MRHETQSNGMHPPYATLESFYSCLRHLKQTQIPHRVDANSVGLGDRSGTWSHVQATMRVLGLIDSKNAPTETLQGLVAAVDGADWPTALRGRVLPKFDLWLADLAPD